MGIPIRVALSGSGFLLPAHVGALHAIHDAGYEPVELAGTSGGAIVAALAAAGASLDTMQTLALEQDWVPMMACSWRNIFNLVALSTGKPVLEFLEINTKGLVFSELPVALKIVASDITNKKSFLFSSTDTPHASVALAARASAAIPFVYEPVLYKNSVLFDGGIVNNSPGDLLTKGDSVLRVGIDLYAKTSLMRPAEYSLLRAIPRFIDMLLASSESAHIANGAANGVEIVQIDTRSASGLNRKMPLVTRKRLYSDGYRATYAKLTGIDKPRSMLWAVPEIQKRSA